MIPSLHVRGHVGWVNPETRGKPSHGALTWLFYNIFFFGKQMGLPDPDFYLLFLSKVPQGFLPFPKAGHRSSDGERRATSADLLLKALVCLNILLPCFFCFWKLERCLSLLIPRLKIMIDVTKGPQFTSWVKKHTNNHQKNPPKIKNSENTLWQPSPPSPPLDCWNGFPGDSSRNSASSGEIIMVFSGPYTCLEGPGESRSRKAPGNY